MCYRACGEELLGAEGAIRLYVFVEVRSLSLELLCDFWFDRTKGTVLPTMLSLEAGKC